MEEFSEMFTILKSIILENKWALSVFIITLLIIEYLEFLRRRDEDD